MSPMSPMSPMSMRDSIEHLRPRDSVGALYFGGCLITTALAAALSLGDELLFWLAGQLLLALALVQWFVLLHECGHGILFRSPRLNAFAGHVAGVFSFIPFSVWTAIHDQHHRWAGWQDVDPTTATLVPRRLTSGEKLLMNFCWRFWVPLFVTLYRINNFWSFRRSRALFSDRDLRRRFTLGRLALLALYGLLVLALGPLSTLRSFGAGVLLSMIFLDSLILSQHTHIPMTLSGGRAVEPYPARAQDAFTRSLRFPRWFAQWFLVNVNAHELHHVHPYVPGYFLSRVPFSPKNEASGWRWFLAARRLPGEVFLFQNRDQSGSEV